VFGNNTKPEHQRILGALNLVVDKNYMIYVRPNGEIEGLCPPDSEQSYTDPQLNIKRSRVKFWNLDGEKDLEEKHGWRKKRSERVDLLPIEHSGGIALTQINQEGEMTPIQTPPQSQRLQNRMEDLQAKVSELNKVQREYKQKDNHYKKLQSKINSLKEEKKKLDEENEALRNSNEQLDRENDILKARNVAMVSWRRTLMGEIEAMEDRHGKIVDELKDIFEDAEEARLSKLNAKGVDARIDRKEYEVKEKGEGGGSPNAEGTGGQGMNTQEAAEGA
jgi:FtsZ-binding cell division protein ZapB